MNRKEHLLFISFFTDIIRSGPEINQDPASNICQRVSINWVKMDKADYISELLKNSLHLLCHFSVRTSQSTFTFYSCIQINLKWGTLDLSEVNLIYLYSPTCCKKSVTRFEYRKHTLSEFKVDVWGMLHIWWAEDLDWAYKDTTLY